MMLNKKEKFNKTLQDHLKAISDRDIEVFRRHITRNENLYTIVQNGHAFTTPEELIEIHEEWFKDPNWIWEGSVVHTLIGEDIAMALIKYDYRNSREHEPFSNWLTYVWKLEDGDWKIAHDQSTAIDYHAFAESSGLNE